MEWINVKDRLPEEDEILVNNPNDGLSPKTTKKLIVLTDMDTVTDNTRVKMQVGEKEWVWMMGYEGEVITHWTVFEPPTD